MSDATVNDNSHESQSSISDDADYVEQTESRLDEITIISDANCVPNEKFKRRVQFLPDGILVRVREIPARSHTSSDSDESSNESKSESEETDSDDSDPDNDESAPQANQLPPDPQVSTITSATTPSLKLNIKTLEPYINNVNNSFKPTSTLVKSTEPQPSVSVPKQNSLPEKTKRTPSAKPIKQIKLAEKKSLKTEGNKSHDVVKRAKSPKKLILPTSKQSKNSPPVAKYETKLKQTLTPRRIKSAPANQQLAARRSNVTAVSTSLTLLPSSLDSYKDRSTDRVAMAMQSLSMKHLCAVEEFAFPARQVSNVHLPILQNNAKLLSSDTLLRSHKEDFDRRSSGDQKYYNVQRQGTHQQQILPPQSGTNQRHYAWQMANSSATETLQKTPSIAQLWDSDNQVYSGYSEHFS